MQVGIAQRAIFSPYDLVGRPVAPLLEVVVVLVVDHHYATLHALPVVVPQEFAVASAVGFDLPGLAMAGLRPELGLEIDGCGDLDRDRPGRAAALRAVILIASQLGPAGHAGVPLHRLHRK